MNEGASVANFKLISFVPFVPFVLFVATSSFGDASYRCPRAFRIQSNETVIN